METSSRSRWTALAAPSLATGTPIDPYLRWNGATEFRDVCTEGPPEEITVIVQLRTNAGDDGVQRLASALQGIGSVRRAYVNAPVTFCVCRWTPEVFSAARWPSVSALVERFNLAMDLLPQRPWCSDKKGLSASRRLAPPEPCAGHTLIGVIDTAFAFAHQQLRSRIHRLWDQEPVPTLPNDIGVVPDRFGYGCELSPKDIEQLIRSDPSKSTVDEDASYEAAGCSPLRSRFAHGTAVAGLVAGTRSLEHALPREPGGFPDFATSATPGASMVLVQLPRSAVQDGAGQGLAAHVLDGLHYILGCVGKDTRQVVVNLSFAYQTGPHDGTSMLEEAMDELVTQCANRKLALKIVLPTGNTFLDRCHARFQVCDEGDSLDLLVPGDNEVTTFAEVWLPDDAEYTAELTAPDGDTSGGVRRNRAKVLRCNGAVRSAVIHGARSPRGVGRGGMVLIAIAATKSLDTPAICAPCGRWKLTLRRVKPRLEPPGEVSVWVAFSQRNTGALPRARQARFVDASWDPYRHLRPALDDLDPRCKIRRRGTISGIATGSAITVVAGNFWRGLEQPVPARRGHEGAVALLPAREHAFYSGADESGTPVPLPYRGMAPARRFVSAACEESWVLSGIPAIGSRSGSTVRARGTSFAAPQVARRYALDGQLIADRGAAAPALGGEGSVDP